MAINERVITGTTAAAGNGGSGSGNQEEGLILHLDANDVDSYDGDGTEWVDIANHEYKPATNVSEHFNTVLYSGNSGTNEITGVGFQPDLVWIKNRASGSHGWVDSVRGNNSVIFSDSSADDSALTGGDISMDTDGFDINTYSSSWANTSSNSYVAWCFKAGGAPTAANPYMIDGTGYSTLSAAGLGDDGDLDLHEASINTKLGFAIYRFDPNTSSSETNSFDHGLGQTPELIITKSTSGVYHWWTWTNTIDGSWDYLKLNSSDATTDDTLTNGAFADSTKMRFNYSFTGTSSGHIAYAFTSKRGVSKVGSYAGGAAGNKIYTGFEPAFVMVKRTNGSGSWEMFDNKRGKTKKVWANENLAEVTNTSPSYIEFNRDGFSHPITSTGANSSGNTYIYLAFAKDTNFDDLIDDTDLELHLDAASFPQKGESGYSNTPSTWTDSSGNSNNGTISGATFDSELGNWLDFDGFNDEVNWSTFPTAFQSLTAITMELWVKFDTVSGTQYPIWLGRAASGKSVNIGLVGGKIQTWVGTGGYPSLFTPVANKWYHLAVTISGTQQTVYVDGEDYTNNSNTQGLSMDSNAANAFLLGDYSGGTADFNGQIGQVRIYSSALSQDQIRQNFNFTKNDYPNGINGLLGSGTTNNMPSWDSTNGYFHFDGSNDWVRLTDNTTRSLNQSIVSYSLWVNLDQLKNYQWAFSIGSGQQIETYFAVYGNGVAQGAIRGARCIMDSTATEGNPGSFPTGQWVHIAMTVNSNNNTEIYKNGVLIDNSASHSTSEPSNTLMYKQFYIGARYNNSSSTGSDSGLASYYFDGKINKLKFYDRPLTSQEISDLNDEGYN